MEPDSDNELNRSSRADAENGGSGVALSANQRRHWMLWRMAAGRPTVIVTSAALLGDNLEASVVTARMAAVVARYPGLVARYRSDEPRILEVDRHLAIVPRVTWASLGETLGQAAARLARDLAGRPFDLSVEPPLRAALVRQGGASALVLAAHPIAADEHSLETILREIVGSTRVGDGRAREDAKPFTPAVSVECAVDETSAWPAARQDFAEMVREAPASLDLPTDSVRPAVFDAQAARIDLGLPIECARGVFAAATAWHVDPQSVLLAAWGAVIRRYTRATGVLVGIDGDTRPSRAPSAVGGFGNPLPVLLVAGGPTTTSVELARAAQTALDERRKHRMLPFADLIEHLGLAPDPARSPLFQVLFAYRERSPGEMEWLLPVSAGLVAHDLEIAFDRRDARMSMSLTFPRSIFRPATVERLARHFQTFLQALVSEPKVPVSHISLVPAEERDWIHAVSGIERAERLQDTIRERIEAQARLCPDATAVNLGTSRLTYAELDRRANQIAHVLVRMGVGADVRVGVLLERSLDLIAVLLGIWKAGGAYVPIEPANPPDRIAFVLRDCGAAVLVSDHAMVSRWSEQALTIPVLFAESGLAAFDGERDFAPGVALELSALAYVIYTSGSTGVPKGVMVEHRQLARLFSATFDWYRFDATDVWTMFHSVAFDFSVWEIWGALLYGGRLVLVPYSVSRSPEDFYRLLSAEKVTVLNQTPSAFRALISAEDVVGQSPLALRYVIFGGEALEFESLRPWFDRHGDEQPRLVNMYGITETTVHVTYRPLGLSDLDRPGGASLIGRAIPDLSVYVVDEHLQLCPVGVPGEMLVGGDGVARGYLGRPELTAERFLEDRFSKRTGARLYRTGDLARLLPSGELDYLGRIDQQVKIRGFRIELGEIEAALRRSGAVRDVAVLPHVRDRRETLLVAYCVTDRKASELREIARGKLPEYMVPSYFVKVGAIAMTANGKVDRRALPPPTEAADPTETEVLPTGKLEELIASVWREVLGCATVDAERSFFEVGGTSVAVVRVATLMRERLGRDIPVVAMFQHPTIRSLARHLQQAPESSAGSARSRAAARGSVAGKPFGEEPIAIIGFAGRFPGANDVDTLWRNLVEGVDSVTTFSREELDPSLDPAQTQDPAYVPVRGVLDDAALFDAAFFAISPREADIIDPQQRLLLEVAWEALERSGYDPRAFPGLIAVYCGEYNDSYYTENVLRRPDVVEAVGAFQAMAGNEKDFIATRIAHRLGLRGPALSLHTACSTSLVAVANAFWSLRTGQCDIALAGAAAVTSPPKSGHIYQEGAMLSADGHTRTFDAAASGTVFSDGAGMLVLRRLSDALDAGDHIHAVIRGVATNNDGAERMSFSAPSVEGQSACIRAALEAAGLSAEDLSYVEAHGTATPLGDPIEIEALRQAFATKRRQYCAIGSIKSNFGHLTAPSGAAGLIKTALALENQQIPPSLHYERPNPKIDFSATPFYVQASLATWPRQPGAPRRAGVSSFGVGGTNAHVVVEEAPMVPPSDPARPSELLVLSAKTPSALAQAEARLADFLDKHPDVSLADVAHTLQVGRQPMAFRRSAVAATVADAARLLGKTSVPQRTRASSPAVVFAFPGQGSQVARMGRELYTVDSGFRDTVDSCAKILEPELGRDLREILYQMDDKSGAALLRQTQFTQPALFTIEYALAQLWLRAGVQPVTMLGHSVGEFAAAALAGVMTLADALRLVAARGRLMQSLPAGTMLSIRSRASSLVLPHDVDLAAVNAPNLCVVSGPEGAIESYRVGLESQGVAASRLQTSHAFHSAMMDPIVDTFAELVRQVPLSIPKRPFLSTVTAQPITDAEATDPGYWARHVRATVRFADTLTCAWSGDPERIILEVGPRTVATTLARQTASDPARQIAIASLDASAARGSDWAAWLSAVGQLWSLGVAVDWSVVHGVLRRQRIPLPTYAWDHKRYWIEPPADEVLDASPEAIGPIESLVAEQLDLMERQLDLLGDSGD